MGEAAALPTALVDEERRKTLRPVVQPSQAVELAEKLFGLKVDAGPTKLDSYDDVNYRLRVGDASYVFKAMRNTGQQEDASAFPGCTVANNLSDLSTNFCLSAYLLVSLQAVSNPIFFRVHSAGAQRRGERERAIYPRTERGHVLGQGECYVVPDAPYVEERQAHREGKAGL
eukprot:6191955-Pleurochrysis_carterae.AAC.3